jgi:hypothetical protein
MGYPLFHDVKYYLGIERNEDDYILATIVDQSTKLFESLTGRVFAVSTPTSRTFATDSREFLTNKKLFFFDDICRIDSLTIAGENVPSTNFRLPNETPYAYLELKASSPLFFQNYSVSVDPTEVVVTGLWGYSTDCPADVFSAILRLSAWKYHQKDTGADYDRPVIFQDKIATPIGLPNDVMDVVRLYRKIL